MKSSNDNEKTLRLKRFNDFYEIIDTISESKFNNPIDTHIFQKPFEEIENKNINELLSMDSYNNYFKNLSEGLLNKDYNTYIRFNAAFYFYNEMERFKNYYENGKDAKINLTKLMTVPKRNKYAFIKAVIRIHYFFHSDLLQEKIQNSLLRIDKITYRDFRSLTDNDWEEISNKFKVNLEYKNEIDGILEN
jgi:hypothetical protein